MTIIKEALPHGAGEGITRVALRADRMTLAKRRWRGVAEDGEEFGFDLDHALGAEMEFHAAGGKVYFLEQTPETVIEVALPERAREAAELAWQIGNLHFAIEAAGRVLRVADDPAIRHLLERAHIGYATREAVFRPLSAAHGNHHHH